MDRNLATVSDVAGETFDFVIVGGGTAGLVVAARLSENPNFTVVVLEAGRAHFDDPLITSTSRPQFANPEYDWAFMTVPQAKANGKPMLWSRGKGLGGSSAMNFRLWNRAQREDIEAWGVLGNTGWTWDRFLEYSRKTERYVPATKPAPEDVYAGESAGTEGPITISFPPTVSGAELPFGQSLGAFDVPLSEDAASGGNAFGTWKSLHAFDLETLTRSYSVNAYLLPAIDRPNLRVLTEAYVLKIVTVKDADGQIVASGVELEHAGQMHTVNARKEVILSAGAIKSPHILELSGIGDRTILEPLGIPVYLDLSAVGTNAQEHITHTKLLYEMKGHSFITAHSLGNPTLRAKLLEAQPDVIDPVDLALAGVSFMPLQRISERAGEIVAALEAKIVREAGSYPPGLLEQYECQLKMLKDPNVPDVEIITTPHVFDPLYAEKPIVGLLPTLSHPFSRGTIHASSADARVQPTIDPRYFDEEVDVQLFAETWKFARRVARTGAFGEAIVAEVSPGPEVETDEQIADYIRDNYTTTWHTFGTLSMLPKDKGGVVDSELKIYGTKNIRVVDLSIVPLSVTTHTQATVYAIAEQAADMIKEKHFS